MLSSNNCITGLLIRLMITSDCFQLCVPTKLFPISRTTSTLVDNSRDSLGALPMCSVPLGILIPTKMCNLCENRVHFALSHDLIGVQPPMLALCFPLGNLRSRSWLPEYSSFRRQWGSVAFSFLLVQLLQLILAWNHPNHCHHCLISRERVFAVWAGKIDSP